MIGELLKVGDVVVLNIPDENWNGGYRPVANQKGTEMTVSGFGEITNSRIQCYGREPGVYVNHCWVYLEGLSDAVYHGFMELKDTEEAKRRTAGWDWAAHRNQQKPIRPLPVMKFWEQDVVSVDWDKISEHGSYWEGKEIAVERIEYNYLGQKRLDGSPMPEYSVGPVGGGGGTVAINESIMTLVRRGNVWRYFNGEKPVFADLNEEASFFKMIGHCDEVRNPANSLYSWTLEEILKAIADDIVDGFSVGASMFSTKMRHSAIRFRDRDLGSRVREATLKGFNMEIPK